MKNAHGLRRFLARGPAVRRVRAHARTQRERRPRRWLAIAAGVSLRVVVSASMVPDATAVLEEHHLTNRDTGGQYHASGYNIGPTASLMSIGTRNVGTHITHIHQKSLAANRTSFDPFCT